MKVQRYKVEKTFLKQRIDIYLMERLSYSRNKIRQLIIEGKVLVNEKKVKNNYLLKEGDIITVSYLGEETFLKPEKRALNIIYEDNEIIVINKENGVIVHPTSNNKKGTLVNGLLYYASSLSDFSGELRPGIVHRLDAFTTGLLVVAKNNEAHKNLSYQFQARTVIRKYLALVWGIIKNDTGTIEAPLGRSPRNRKKQIVTAYNSKEAITHFKVIKRFKRVTLVEVSLETGRTHQIRVHFNYIGYPLVNDPVYGRRQLIDDSGPLLHAKTLGFKHPRTNKELKFSCPPPLCFTDILEKLSEE